MKKLEAERPREAGKMVSALAPPLAGGALCGASDSDVLTDTSSAQSSDVDRASIRSVDERVEVSTYLISTKIQEPGEHKGLMDECKGADELI